MDIPFFDRKETDLAHFAEARQISFLTKTTFHSTMLSYERKIVALKKEHFLPFFNKRHLQASYCTFDNFEDFAQEK